jgi:hypothetical protein
MSVSYGGDSITFGDGTIVSSGSQGFKNKIINGNMAIDQRNAGANVTLSNTGETYQSVDRWNSNISSGLNNKVVVRQIDGANTSQSNYESGGSPPNHQYSLKISVATANTVSSGDVINIRQRVEYSNMYDVGWGTATASPLTLSFWVKSSITGTHGVFIHNGFDSTRMALTYTINTANTWEYKTLYIAPQTSTYSSTAWNATGLVIAFNVACGSNYLGATAGIWTTSGSYYGVTGQVNLLPTVNSNLYISGVQLEKGSTASTYEYRSYQKELILCQRYYARMPITGTYSLESYQGVTGYNRCLRTYTPFPVTMRATPNRVVVTTGSFTNVRGSSTTYAGLAPQSPSHADSFIETNNSTGLASYTSAADAMDAEL